MPLIYRLKSELISIDKVDIILKLQKYIIYPPTGDIVKYFLSSVIVECPHLNGRRIYNSTLTVPRKHTTIK